jgi:hypothetical protein
MGSLVAMFRLAAIVRQINSAFDGYEKKHAKLRPKLFARPVMARASKGLSSQQSRAAESILPAARNVLAKAKLESHTQAVSNPQSLSPVVP